MMFIISCDNEIHLKQINTEVSLSIEQLPDSSYISEVSSMHYFEKNLIACLYGRSQFVRLNNDLEFLNYIGREGRASNELMYVSSFICKDDTIITMDMSDQFKFFTKDGLYIRSIKVNAYRPVTRLYCYHDNNFIFSTGKEIPMVHINVNNNISKEFGEPILFDNVTQTKNRNCRLLLNNGNDIISLSDNKPIIEIYDEKTLSLLYSFDYSKIDIVSDQLKYASNQTIADNQYIRLVKYADYHDGKLYILISHNSNNISNSNNIISFDLYQDCKPIAIYKLPGLVYESFCIGDDCIYAYNSVNSIIEKVIPK